MRAGSQFNWYDLSSLATTQEITTDTSSIVHYLCLITSDKGTEDLYTSSGQDWISMYGKIPSFEKHGQPLIQAHNIIKAGGVCITKRLVADDATLSNIAVVATVKKATRDKKNTDGQQIYIDKTSGNETTEPGETDTPNEKATYNVAVITHSLKSIENVKTKAVAVEAVKKLTDKENGVFPLYVIADNGRGVSGKKVKLTPNYVASKNSNHMFYTAAEIENTETVESSTFTIDPDIIYGNKAYDLCDSTLSQLKCETISKNVTDFVTALAEISGFGAEYLLTQDFLFGRTRKDAALANIEFDEASANITATYGVELQNGTNGNFGDAPFGTAEYEAAALSYLRGNVSDEIYDFTACNPDVCFDANYPVAVKRELEIFADFRQDFVFFEDLGLGLSTYESIYAAANNSDVNRSKFNALYCTSYDIYDPTTKKPVEVTMTYGMAPLMVKFFTGGRNRPLCGPGNSMAITDYIPGSVRYSPRITPKVDQKELLEDIRVNYATKTDASTEQLVIETCYTSREEFTQASFVNNILMIQQVVKAIREFSPKIRYSFYVSSDFTNYKETIEKNVLSNYTSYFKTLELVYTQDEVMSKQKIFKAALNVTCGDFIQSEIYDVFIIN